MQQGIYKDRFFKVSRRLIKSSLWCESGDVIKVFLVLLEEAQDPASAMDGTVYMAKKQLAAKCFVTEESLDNCLQVLSSPDPQSRTEYAEGRRIEILPNGYRILNFALYHDKAKDVLLSRIRSESGKKGGRPKSPHKEPVCNQLHITNQNESKPELEEKQKPLETETEKELETEKETNTSNEYIARLSASEIADRYTACFNLTLGRRVGVMPKLEGKIQERLREGYRPWQIIALPIAVDAQGLGEARASAQLDWFLRDGKSPRLRNGQTWGATDWVERAVQKLDQTRLNPRQAAIAEKFGVLDQMKQAGVKVPE
jgi:hypothetical protein